jgi:hypothetical protein
MRAKSPGQAPDSLDYFFQSQCNKNLPSYSVVNILVFLCVPTHYCTFCVDKQARVFHTCTHHRLNQSEPMNVKLVSYTEE